LDEAELRQGIKDEIAAHVRSRRELGQKIKALKEQVKVKNEALQVALELPDLIEDKFYERMPVTPSRDYYKEEKLDKAKKRIPKVIKQIKAAIDA
jgi:hypothetical protein